MMIYKKKVVLACLLISSAVSAEQTKEQSTLTKLNISKYCYYDNLKYSKGAEIRTQTDTVLVCRKSKDNKKLIWVKTSPN
ncbi:MAG: DUF1496 domain-containing protein [Aliivibrio sp.]|uniref:DUF1496 domain-containing protein n=1 Tax=Aliivibrio sp. TaxID=1872443 RepID=UPI001A4FE72C|nr:DUF1496 domain-containing protein [Aliivibrio sp.]